jgi:trehalose 6-phosphate phosphatase
MMMTGARALHLAEPHTGLQQFIEEVAESRHSALLLDYDGTLAPFTVDRREALPYSGVVPVVQQIMACGRTRVVIVTGRSAREILPLLGLHPTPEIWGAHGLQRLRPDGVCETLHLDEEASGALDDADRWLKGKGLGSLAEHKPGSIAVHWRGLPDEKAAEVRDQVLLGWFPIAQDSLMSILEFDGGVEIRTPGLDKGDAVRAIAKEMDQQSPIAYLGDDATDESAFNALGTRGLSVLVRPEWRKTSAQLWLRPPGQLLDFLTRWRDACCKKPGDNCCGGLPGEKSQ